MAKCLNCTKHCNNEGIIVVDSSRKMEFGYTWFYNICNKCQFEILKRLETINKMNKAIQDIEERRERFSETRNWCRECWQDIKDFRWTMIFVDVNGYVKNTSYVHGKCCNDIQKRYHFENQREMRESEQTCLT